MVFPNFDDEFIILSDASDTVVGFVLAQERNVKETAICYGGHALTKPQRNYSTWEKELLGIVEALREFDPYVQYAKFTLVTNHSCLVWLFSKCEPKSKLARWIILLQQ